LVILAASGEVLLFSGNQLHASTPNTSGLARFSVDFRTVYVPDLMAGRGAPLVDVHCTGTPIRDFINVSDEPFRRADRHRPVRRATGRCDARVRGSSRQGQAGWPLGITIGGWVLFYEVVVRVKWLCACKFPVR
jgi:hypothetical protein